METSICYTDRDVAYISTDERRWIKKLLALHEDRPDEVTIDNRPEENDGCLCCRVPVSWIKIGPPRRVELTEEQRQAASERMKALRMILNSDEESEN